ncbi:PAC2 family protein [Aeromicrobium phragmitis]|uniref:PAC2 family protein n=1 Tax=Aeromicrobium phragmitis TaxID=2478914 RepID=A0A3L8PJ84_9ACTN|nr:PAC2 family protein [Aeromicrobium phragmitis]RLV55260.1 PAC2 family protein [Aeromicrobium phragmitis]
MTPKWFSSNRQSRDRAARREPGPVLIHVLEGFLSAGSSATLAAAQLRGDDSEVVHEFDLDPIYDYRARRPPIVFDGDHYRDYEEPRLAITREHDVQGREFLLLSGPEPDFGWEHFVAEVISVVERENVSLTVGLGAVPMGVPHTRPPMITAHATRPELVDRRNLWEAEITIPSSAQALLEYRLGQRGHDAIGYVVHVPHYLTQVEYPTAAIALLEALAVRLGLTFDLETLRAAQPEAIAQIDEQIAEQHGEDVLNGLEQQYDAFARGAARSLLEDDDRLPSGEELASQLERFLAQHRGDDQG